MKPEPARQHHTRLRPAEHTGNGAQILDRVGLDAARGAQSDLQRRDLGNRRHRPKEASEIRRFIGERAVRGERIGRKPVHRLPKARRISGCDLARSDLGRHHARLRCHDAGRPMSTDYIRSAGTALRRPDRGSHRGRIRPRKRMSGFCEIGAEAMVRCRSTANPGSSRGVS